MLTKDSKIVNNLILKKVSIKSLRNSRLKTLDLRAEVSPGQTGNVQSSQSGLSPMKTLASEDLPTPVAPMITM